MFNVTRIMLRECKLSSRNEWFVRMEITDPRENDGEPMTKWLRASESDAVADRLEVRLIQDRTEAQ